MNKKYSVFSALAVLAIVCLAAFAWSAPRQTKDVPNADSLSIVASQDTGPAPVAAMVHTVVAIVQRSGGTLLALLAMGGLAFAFVVHRTRGGRLVSAINTLPSNVGSSNQVRRYLASAAVATRFLFCKVGADDEHIAVVAATADQPIGVMLDEAAAAEDPMAVALLGAGRTLVCVASEAIALGAEVYTTAAGKVQDEPAIAGTYWKVGTALTAPGADGDPVEILTCEPEKVVVIAALTAPTTAAGSDAGTTQTLANACKADLVAIDNALASAARLKVI